jgi:hypothetical protein
MNIFFFKGKNKRKNNPSASSGGFSSPPIANSTVINNASSVYMNDGDNFFNLDGYNNQQPVDFYQPTGNQPISTSK